MKSSKLSSRQKPSRIKYSKASLIFSKIHGRNRREKTRINKDDMFNYLFTVDGRRISSIFDISKINRVLIAGKEKYNIVPLKGYVTDNEETKEAEEKGVVNAVKQACAQWFEQNSIPLDDEFKDVKLARKTAKMHQFSNSKERDNMIDSEMNNSNKASPYANKRINIQEALQNEDILEKVIEMTIQKKQKIKQDKEFYNSLKSNKNQNELDHYCYMNKGVNLPGSQFNVKKARFISLKGVNDQNEEVEKPLFEDSAVSNAIKDPQNKLFAKSSNNVDAKTNANLSKSFRNQNNLMNKSNITNKSGVKPGGKEKESTLDIVKSVCEKYGLTRREAFEIHSQFKAMTVPYEKKKPGTSANDDYIDALLKLNKSSMPKNNVSKANLNESSSNPQNANHSAFDEEKPEGIKLDYFGENCSFLHGVHSEVKIRLFKAIGIDTESRYTHIENESIQ